MHMTPEQIARQKIDATLEASGWIIQDMKEFNRNAALGVAVREFRNRQNNRIFFSLP
jgi:type I restriction enzyme R subunit